MKRALLATTAMISALCYGAPALAQSSTTVPAKSPDPASSSADDIIVTASRREETLQRAPLAVTAVTGDSLKQQGVVQPQDLSKAIAGLNISPVGASTQIYLRGVGTFAVGPFAESAVAFNVDDIFMSLPQFIGGQFYDLQRVEVLKGPQGTLYGRNATAGAINLITNRPTFDTSVTASLELGNYGLGRFNGALNLPLSSNLAVRGSLQITQHNGYATDGYDDENSKSGRLQLFYKPTARSSVLLSADFVNSDAQSVGWYPLNPNASSATGANPSNPWEGPSTATSNRFLTQANSTPPYSLLGVALPLIDNKGFAKTNIWGVKAEFKQDLGFATLTVIPSYRSLTLHDRQEPGFVVNSDQKAYQDSVEARLASNGSGGFNWLVGGYYFHNKNSSHVITLQGVADGDQHSTQTIDSLAGFGQATYKVTNSLRVTGGIRYTKETRDQTGSGTLTTRFPPPALPVAPVVTTYSIPGHASFDNVSFKAGAEYDIAPASLAYASISTGFKSGGINADINNTFRPEKLTAYTVGFKNRFFANLLQANIELFWWDYRNHQENILSPLNIGGFAPIVLNVDKATAKGANIDITIHATKNDLFTAQVEYLDATFDKFVVQRAVTPSAQATTCAVTPLAPSAPGAPPPALVNCSGKPFTRAPKWSATVGYRHSFKVEPGKIVASASAQLSTGFYLATDYIAQEKQKAFGLIDLGLAFEAISGWSIAGYVRNVTNHAVYSSAFQQPFSDGLVYATLRPPRTYSVVLSTKF